MGIRRAAQYATFAGAALMVSAGTALAAAAEATALPEDAVVGGYVPMKPTEGKGMPTPGAIGFQEQFSPIGEYGQWMHNAVLMPIITAISLLVLLLLLWVVVRYRTKANPKPSRPSHNTLIEVVWTLLPVLVLLGIAVPSMRLLASQYETAPEGALTVKVTGYQWYWGYTYPDYGGFEVISNMLPEDEALANGEPTQLAVDKRMVVPAGVPIRIQTIGADVIHSFAVPSLWFKLDAVPGRLNEKVMFIEEPGVYYGQCMELCGARHGFMPIAVEALPRDKFEQWVLEQPGGTLGEPAMTDVNMPVQEPESAVPGAAGAPRPDSALEEDVDAAEPAPTAA
ncbi:MAG: cytochrome c oxidase subunit II [Croceicoccus sp.]|nr:cytochrome c oxidase subunit II [Croceicoccus sp.]